MSSNTQWTPELKERVKELYLAEEPTPENSTEIVKSIAEGLELSPNGVRMVLSQLGVYVKKEVGTTASKTSSKTSGEGTKRVSKESAIADLTKAIEDRGSEVDADILSKLTGKAAVYFLKVLST